MGLLSLFLFVLFCCMYECLVYGHASFLMFNFLEDKIQRSDKHFLYFIHLFFLPFLFLILCCKSCCDEKRYLFVIAVPVSDHSYYVENIFFCSHRPFLDLFLSLCC